MTSKLPWNFVKKWKTQRIRERIIFFQVVSWQKVVIPHEIRQDKPTTICWDRWWSTAIAIVIMVLGVEKLPGGGYHWHSNCSVRSLWWVALRVDRTRVHLMNHMEEWLYILLRGLFLFGWFELKHISRVTKLYLRWLYLSQAYVFFGWYEPNIYIYIYLKWHLHFFGSPAKLVVDFPAFQRATQPEVTVWWR